MKQEDYKLIPMKDIEPEARRIAILWIEGFEPDLGFQINQRHKLASDLMNYGNQRIYFIKKEIEKQINLIGIPAYDDDFKSGQLDSLQHILKMISN